MGLSSTYVTFMETLNLVPKNTKGEASKHLDLWLLLKTGQQSGATDPDGTCYNCVADQLASHGKSSTI